MEQRFFIAGATGYTGRAVVRQLCAANISVVAHIRADSPKGDLWRTTFKDQGATVVQTSWEEQSIAQALSQHSPTHVFSLLGTTKHKNKSEAQRGKEASYELIDRDLSLLLLKCSEALETKPLFLFLSSMGVVDNTQNRYLRARADVERAIKLSELSWLIAQPAFISGSDRKEFRPLERFGALVGDGVLNGLSFLGGTALRNKYASLTSDQLAAGLISWALQDPPSSRYLSAEDLRSGL